MKTIVALIIFAFVLCPCYAVETGSVTFDWAIVGNPGNADGFRGFGGVDYTYRISKLEVTNAQYIKFLNAVAAVGDAYGLYSTLMAGPRGGIDRTGAGTVGDPYSYSIKGGDSNWFDRPVNLVSWGDAARFTNWLHNGQPTGLQDLTTTEDGAYYLDGATSDVALLAVSRELDATHFITSVDEWYKAAYHKNDGVTGNYFDFAISGDTEPSNELINPDPGNNANFYLSGYTIGSPYYTTEVGEFENSRSPYGTFDQGGNVLEWNEAVIGSTYRGLRGGSFARGDLHADSEFYFRRPTDELTNVGFRVASIPEPCTLLLTIGAAGVMIVWRTISAHL